MVIVNAKSFFFTICSYSQTEEGVYMYSVQTVRERIKIMAQKKGITQKQMLAECHINENIITKMGRDKGMGSFMLAAIADKLDCSTDYLLGRTDMPEVSRPSGLTQEEEDIIQMFRDLDLPGKIRAYDRVKVLHDDFCEKNKPS